MSLRSVIVATLLLGDQYGLQLHHEIVTRTARTRPLNVGQIYSTLDRLRAAGLVTETGRTDDDLTLHGLTPAGLEAARAWSTSPVHPLDWSEMREQILLVSSLPGEPVGNLVSAYDHEWSAAAASETPDDLGADTALAAAAVTWLRGIDATTRRERALDGTRPPRGRRPRSVHLASA